MSPKNSQMSRLPIEVPVIDVSPLLSDEGASAAARAVADRIRSACRGSGFFYASGHGVDVGELSRMADLLHRSVTREEKRALAIRAYNGSSPRDRSGFYLSVEGRKAVESFCYLNPAFDDRHPRIRSGTPAHEVNVWPEGRPEIRAYFEGHYRAMFRLSARLLRGFALALGRDASFFEPHFREDSTLSSASLIRYPRLEDYPPVKVGPDGTPLSFEDHLDVSLITVLWQTPVPNLQAEAEGGRFRDVPTSGDHFLVNCGTYMAHVTNGFFRAPNHRVKFVNEERLSLPFFVNLGHESAPTPFFPDDGGREGGNEPLPYGEYLQRELKALIVKNGQT